MIFIVIPVYNEEDAIDTTIKDLQEKGFKNIIVVDDGSSDQTFERAQKTGVIILRHQLNRGQGAALQTGNEFALKQGASIVVHFDGDGQFNSNDIMPAIEFMKLHEVDMVLGSRFLDTRSIIPFTKRYILLPIGKWINYLLTGVKLSDVHNGFRIYSKKALQEIIITQDKMAHNSEITASLKKKALTYKEFPVEVKYYRYGQGIKGGLKIIKEWFFFILTR